MNQPAEIAFRALLDSDQQPLHSTYDDVDLKALHERLVEADARYFKRPQMLLPVPLGNRLLRLPKNKTRCAAL